MKILFQGDSITDANRNYQTSDLGFGYVHFIAEAIPKVKVINKGISGNRTLELLERWQTDTLKINPDILSILIGVNEVWHHFRFGKQITKEVYYESYKKLIDQSLKHNPNLKIIIIEPFVLKTGVYEEKWLPFLNDLQRLSKQISMDFGLYFIPMQSILDSYLDRHNPEELLEDGVHPTRFGHEIMAFHILEILKKVMA